MILRSFMGRRAMACRGARTSPLLQWGMMEQDRGQLGKGRRNKYGVHSQRRRLISFIP